MVYLEFKISSDEVFVSWIKIESRKLLQAGEKPWKVKEPEELRARCVVRTQFIICEWEKGNCRGGFKKRHRLDRQGWISYFQNFNQVTFLSEIKSLHGNLIHTIDKILVCSD